MNCNGSKIDGKKGFIFLLINKYVVCIQVGVSSLHADANPHYGTGNGATIYRFVSDQFSSFYTKVINTNARDAVHVIDGLLHHKTDLQIEEHYTDTAGYQYLFIKKLEFKCVLSL